MTREIPLLMSGPMVRAILAGTKTQTRRIVKEQLAGALLASADTIINRRSRYGQPGDRLWIKETFCIEHQVVHDQKPPFDDGRPVENSEDGWRMPHYRASDPTPELCYEDDVSDDPKVKWNASLFMPRKWSRITLEVTDVRIERLQQITQDDARAEGIEPYRGALRWVRYLDALTGEADHSSAREAYQALWEHLNGPGSWDENPWVWVILFKRI